MTEFYQANDGRFSVPVMRARAFLHLCQHKAIYLGKDELIVGERGPAPKVVPTFPKLTCHSVENLRILNSRPKTWYRVDGECIRLYEEKIIPYWRGRSMRDRMFAELPPEWRDAYDAGIFTEFMEQRAPGHTVLDDKIYTKGMLDFKEDIADAIARLDFLNDPEAYEKRETLKSFDISCDALIVFAERHAALARELAAKETRPQRQAELLKIAETCSHVPAQAPCDFHEALQYYWFCHLAVITELNGWDSFNPDTVVEEQLRQGNSLEDARAGGCSGCVEVGAFGKEAYILTGYFNLVKVLELTLHNGLDPRTGKQFGLKTGAPDCFKTYADLFAAFRQQLHHFIEIKIRGSRLIERMYADHMPAPFLSVLIDDCMAKGRDYNAGGARYNNTFIQMAGLGSITDCLSAMKQFCFDGSSLSAGEAGERAGVRWGFRFPNSFPSSTRTSPTTNCSASASSTRPTSTATTTTTPTRSCSMSSTLVSRKSMAGPTRAAAAIAWRCCPPPATSISAA